jgi:heptosyltransferase I
MSYRNWNARGYAQVGDYAIERYGMAVILSGGASALETQMGEQIESDMQHKPLNLISKTNLKQLLYLLDKATVLLSPDSGPAHMATAVCTPVVGLYACTNPERARPYFSTATTVDKYRDAVQKKHGCPASELPWGTRIRAAGTMDLISTRDATEKLDIIMNGLGK